MNTCDLARTHAAAFPATQVWNTDDIAAAQASPGTILTGDADCFVLGRVVLDEAEVLTLATHPSHQRQGLARARLKEFERLARAAGATRVFLEVAADNARARALYANAGYTGAGLRRAYYRNPDGSRTDALVLCKDLP